MLRATKDPDLQRRAAVFAALGDPNRLAIVEALAQTDCSPSELESRLDIPSNLLAHHLDILESVGVVRRLRSAGDGRRRYIRLAPDLSEHQLSSALIRASDVLFVCHHNSARSQFGAAYWNRHSTIPAESAGSQPAALVHPMAVLAAGTRGLDLSGNVPRGFDQLSRVPSLVISVCDVAFEDAAPFSGARRLHWSVPDPASTGDLEAFDVAFAEIAQRIDRLAPSVQSPAS
jgi:protein-tyrosine-phosphatase/DNA-binding HxlR family transcriptional regulator